MTQPSSKFYLSTETTAPNGRSVAENFASWFGYSKVTDEEGEPLRVFHATPEEFDSIRPGGSNPQLSGRAIWFTPNAHSQPAAHNIGRTRGAFKEGTQVLPAFVRMERPLMIDETTVDWSRALYGENFPQLIRDADLDEIKLDYDGILYYYGGKLQEVVVFDGKQVKSAIGNNGNYDRASDSLTDQAPSKLQLRGQLAIEAILAAEKAVIKSAPAIRKRKVAVP